MPAGVLVALAPGGRIVFASERARELFGERLEGSGAAGGLLERVLASGRAQAETVELEAGGGAREPARLRAEPLRDDTGRVRAAVVFIEPAGEADGRDRLIARAREARAAMERTEQRFRSLLDATAQIFWTTDARGRVCDDSPIWRELTGQTREEWLRDGWWTAIHPDDADGARARWAAALASGRYFEAECRIRRKEGGWAFAVARATPVHDPSGAIREWVGTVTDITAHKIVDEERAHLLEREQAARADAESANRSKDEFLATLSHELRTPLNAMLGWAQLLRGNRLDEAGRTHALETIERSAKMQAQLVEDILDVSRIIAGKLRLHLHPVDLRAVTESALDAMRPAAESKQLTLALKLDASAVPVSGDGDRLEQVVTNLVSNAIKFTPRGGRVDVEVERGLHGIIRVRDTGRGINRAFLPYVFDRFRQADAAITRAHGGLGLGLAIVRHLVELHGGAVLAESAGEGRGATFTVTVPVRSQVGDPSEFIEDPTQLDEVPTLGKVRVLVVDDEADARELLSLVLRQQGAEVREAGTAREALMTMKEWRPNVLVSDIGLPGENGYELIRRVRELGEEGGGAIPAVALTAYAGDEDSQRALLAGYQMHVAKPVEPDAFVSVVARVSGWGNGRG
ncbi:MAG TPA: ATP-binding protein [Polyangia bacterium]|nr:ATP-binding protein [Polyangia bacterium]